MLPQVFCGLYAPRFLSKNQEDYLLRYIHERHEKSKEAYQNDFGKDATAQYPKNPLPLTHETVEAYAAPVVVLEKDIKFYKFRLLQNKY